MRRAEAQICRFTLINSARALVFPVWLFALILVPTPMNQPTLTAFLPFPSGCSNYEQFWLTTSLRGLVVGTLRVKMLSEGVHSGAARYVNIDYKLVSHFLSAVSLQRRVVYFGSYLIALRTPKQARSLFLNAFATFLTNTWRTHTKKLKLWAKR